MACWLNENVESELNTLYERYVPPSGKCDNLAGEIVRAFTKITYRFFNDGDMVCRDYGVETCGAPYNFLCKKCENENIISENLAKLKNDSFNNNEIEYEDTLNIIAENIIHLIGTHPEWINTETEDMWEYRR